MGWLPNDKVKEELTQGVGSSTGEMAAWQIRYMGKFSSGFPCLGCFSGDCATYWTEERFSICT